MDRNVAWKAKGIELKKGEKFLMKKHVCEYLKCEKSGCILLSEPWRLKIGEKFQDL